MLKEYTTKDRFDENKFDRLLAKELGGKIVKANRYSTKDEIRLLSDKVQVFSYHGWYGWRSRGRMSFGLRIIGIDYDAHPKEFPHEQCRITVSLDRPIEAIAKDVRRRLIDANAEYVNEELARYARFESDKSDFDNDEVFLDLKFPTISRQRDPLCMRIHHRSGDWRQSFTAVMNYSRKDSIDIKSLPREKLLKILDVLMEDQD